MRRARRDRRILRRRNSSEGVRSNSFCCADSRRRYRYRQRSSERRHLVPGNQEVTLMDRQCRRNRRKRESAMTELNLKTYHTKPAQVEAIQITEDNMEAVAK